MGFHFAKQKMRFLAKTSILSKIPFYPEKPSKLSENFHFALFLEFDQFFSCFLWVFVQILKIAKFQISKFQIMNQTLLIKIQPSDSVAIDEATLELRALEERFVWRVCKQDCSVSGDHFVLTCSVTGNLHAAWCNVSIIAKFNPTVLGCGSVDSNG